jgi:hypothetical protein
MATRTNEESMRRRYLDIEAREGLRRPRRRKAAVGMRLPFTSGHALRPQQSEVLADENSQNIGT